VRIAAQGLLRWACQSSSTFSLIRFSSRDWLRDTLCPSSGSHAVPASRVGPRNFTPSRSQIPDWRLSPHPARATPRKPTGFRRVWELLRLSVDSYSTRVTCSLCSTGMAPFPRSYEAVRPGSVPRSFRPRGISTWAFSLIIPDPVLKFRTKARIRVMPPLRRTPPGPQVRPYPANPRVGYKRWFWYRRLLFDASSKGSLALISLIPT